MNTAKFLCFMFPRFSATAFTEYLKVYLKMRTFEMVVMRISLRNICISEGNQKKSAVSVKLTLLTVLTAKMFKIHKHLAFV